MTASFAYEQASTRERRNTIMLHFYAESYRYQPLFTTLKGKIPYTMQYPGAFRADYSGITPPGG